MSKSLWLANAVITDVCEALKTSDAIPRAIDGFREFLLAKNKAYGNSIYEPVRVFTNASIDTLILVRLNDKATRLLNGESGGEDAFDDLLGYLILRKALPIYLESKATPDPFRLVLSDAERAKTFDRAMAYLDENGFVPDHVVTTSLKNRGLRVGMTYQEVRDNKRTECEAKQDGPLECTEGDPCSACKFLDGAMCECGHPFSWHFPTECGLCQSVGCATFSLASWMPEPSDKERTTVPHDFDPSEGIRTQSNERNALLAAESAQPKKETDMTDTNTKKPRIDRKTWHESAEGSVAVTKVRDALESKPPRSYYARELAPITGLDLSVVGLALERLILTGYADQHGKAKGTRYAHAGFTDWPAPTPRNRKSNEPPVSEADADAAHSLDASDSEET